MNHLLNQAGTGRCPKCPLVSRLVIIAVTPYNVGRSAVRLPLLPRFVFGSADRIVARPAMSEMPEMPELVIIPVGAMIGGCSAGRPVAASPECPNWTRLSVSSLLGRFVPFVRFVAFVPRRVNCPKCTVCATTSLEIPGADRGGDLLVDGMDFLPNRGGDPYD